MPEAELRLSRHNKAACGPNDLSANPGRFIRCQEYRHRRNICDATEPAQRCLVRQCCAGAPVKGPRGNIPFSLGVTRRDGVTAMMGKLPYTLLCDAVFTHPTMAQGLGPLFGEVPARTQTGAPGGSAA